MATTTPNYGLTKPAENEAVQVSVLNGNADIIDTALHDLDTGKQPKEAGKGLSTEDFTTAEKEKLAGLSNTALLGLGTSIPSGSDLNNYKTPGVFFANSSQTSQQISNNPATTPFRLTVEVINDVGRICQTLIPTSISGGIFYKRLFTSTGWQSWYKFQGEAVT